ncbi:hypothetical protein Afil01_01840 [Actinorhabdospora filicis]|uniref:MT0933-like antitoxin protein n=1 Tax=Actinorhabdospora filicis TaxID=1785913 RepID=A0A9W6SGD5_9ACTN|nr:antitoxin [Actinorhabdospora filicis]GLZ75377.1 hypothetical protein Afil01_01840 [Actinorhabdospora filicis]
MGIDDKIREGIDKVKGLVNQHDDKIDAGVDKAADFVNDKTGGKYSDKVDGVAEKIKGMTGDNAPAAQPEDAQPQQ